RLRIALQPGVHLIESRWDLIPVWRGKKKAPLPKRFRAVVFREGFNARVETIAPDEFKALQYLSKKGNLAGLLARLKNRDGGEWLFRRASQGILKPEKFK